MSDNKVLFDGQECLVIITAQNGQKTGYLTNSLWIENPGEDNQRLIIDKFTETAVS